MFEALQSATCYDVEEEYSMHASISISPGDPPQVLHCLALLCRSIDRSRMHVHQRPNLHPCYMNMLILSCMPFLTAVIVFLHLLN